MGFVVSGVDHGYPARLEPIAEGERRMVQIMGDNAQPADAEGTFGEGVIADGGTKLLEGDGEIGIGHLSGEQRLERLPRAPRSIDVPLISRCEQRGEEG